jgi:hypothetical protein
METTEFKTDLVFIIRVVDGSIKLFDDAGNDVTNADNEVDRKNGRITWTCEDADAVVFIKGKSAELGASFLAKASPLNDTILVVRKDSEVVTPIRKLAKAGTYQFGVVVYTQAGTILGPLDPRIIIN